MAFYLYKETLKIHVKEGSFSKTNRQTDDVNQTLRTDETDFHKTQLNV